MGLPLGHDFPVFQDVAEELTRARAKYPQTESCPDGTNEGLRDVADRARQICDFAESRGLLTFAIVLNEEVCEAMCEEDPVKLRAEIVQVMAVCTRWIRAIDRRREVTDGPEETRPEEGSKQEHACSAPDYCPVCDKL